MKTHSLSAKAIQNQWFIVDANGVVLGRLASVLAQRLMGKHKADYSAHLSMGDAIVVINAANIKVTGAKLEDKVYYHHTGYPGGIKEIALKDLLAKDPTEVIRHAVKGMLPKNRLQDVRLGNLKIYAGSEHPHEAQKPTKLEITK